MRWPIGSTDGTTRRARPRIHTVYAGGHGADMVHSWAATPEKVQSLA